MSDVETVVVRLHGMAVATQGGSPQGGGTGTLEVRRVRSGSGAPPGVPAERIQVTIKHLFGFRTSVFDIPASRWPFHTQDERKAAFLAGYAAGWGASGEGQNAEVAGPNRDPVRDAKEVWDGWINHCSGDDGEPGADRQPGPRAQATQEGAATSSQGATAQGAARSAGNVAEPQFGPAEARRAEHPPSPVSRYDAALCANLAAQARRDGRNMTPAPWAFDSRLSPVRVTTEAGDTVAAVHWGPDAVAIARQRNNLRQVAEQLEASRAVESERDAYRAMLCDLVGASFSPEVWARARVMLKYGPGVTQRHPKCGCHQEAGDSACVVHGIETDLGVLLVPCAVCQITAGADDPAGAGWRLAADGWRCSLHLEHGPGEPDAGIVRP